jgi:hypothetical protein
MKKIMQNQFFLFLLINKILYNVYFHIFFTFIAQNTLNRIIVKNITY